MFLLRSLFFKKYFKNIKFWCNNSLWEKKKKDSVYVDRLQFIFTFSGPIVEVLLIFDAQNIS